MTISFMAGRRIQGLDSDRTATQLPSGSVGGWVELARTTLGSNGDNITVSSLPNKRYYMILRSVQGTTVGGAQSVSRFGSGSIDTGSNYATRYNDNGGTDGTYTSGSFMLDGYDGNPELGVHYIANYSTKEKLMTGHLVSQNTAGAGNAPNRREQASKWTNTSNAIDIINLFNNGAADFASGSELVVLGYDPADTHTNNFWEELYSGSGASGMDTGASAFTAKKYLWIQMYLNDMISGANVNMVLNGVESSNYALRYNQNGGADGTITSRSDNLIHLGASNETEAFINMFIINDGSNEKLGIVHNMTQQTAGATTAPARSELVFKDSQTTQITDVEVRRTSGSWGANSQLKIWGAD